MVQIGLKSGVKQTEQYLTFPLEGSGVEVSNGPNESDRMCSLHVWLFQIFDMLVTWHSDA